METDMTSENKSWSLWFGRAVIVTVAFVIYLLSTGPAWWLHKHGVISDSAFTVMYQPIACCIKNSPGDILYRYIDWWSPVI